LPTSRPGAQLFCGTLGNHPAKLRAVPRSCARAARGECSMRGLVHRMLMQHCVMVSCPKPGASEGFPTVARGWLAPERSRSAINAHIVKYGLAQAKPRPRALGRRTRPWDEALGQLARGPGFVARQKCASKNLNTTRVENGPIGCHDFTRANSLKYRERVGLPVSWR